MLTTQEGANDPAMTQVLDAIGVGVWLLDLDGTLRLANQLARRELDEGRALVRRGSSLAAAVPAQERELARALADARAGRRSMLQLGDHGGPRLFAVVPLAASGTSDNAHQILVMCGRPSATEPVSMMLLARAVGLTQCERIVLECLCAGLVAQDIAEQRDVKLSTVRTQICSLRSKMGARNVPQLIAKVSGLPPLASRLAL